MNEKRALNFVKSLSLEPIAKAKRLKPAAAPKARRSKGVAAPKPRRSPAAAAAAAAPLVAFTQDQQAVAIGSQIAAFAAGVPQELRSAISNSVLLAQLAANKAVQNATGSAAAWREAYRNVLFSTGWIFEGSSVSLQEFKKSNLEVHKAIIPVLTAILGPAAGGAALVATIMNGLADMNQDTPWITLFNRESRRASVNQFQVSYVEAPNGNAPRMKLVFFELDATGVVTQILFFKLSSSSAKLFHSDTDLSVNTALLKSIEASLQQKLGERAATFISEIEI